MTYVFSKINKSFYYLTFPVPLIPDKNITRSLCPPLSVRYFLSPYNDFAYNILCSLFPSKNDYNTSSETFPTLNALSRKKLAIISKATDCLKLIIH